MFLNTKDMGYGDNNVHVILADNATTTVDL